MHTTSERSQSGKTTCCMIPTILHSGKGRTMETKRLIDAKGLGEGGPSRQNTEDS